MRSLNLNVDHEQASEYLLSTPTCLSLNSLVERAIILSRSIEIYIELNAMQLVWILFGLISITGLFPSLNAREIPLSFDSVQIEAPSEALGLIRRSIGSKLAESKIFTHII